MRYFAALLLPVAVHAAAVTTLDQIHEYFCGQLVSCYGYPFSPLAVSPVPEPPGYTLGPYDTGTLILDGSQVSEYPGTLLQFSRDVTDEAVVYQYGEAIFFAALGELGADGNFEMTAQSELMATADPAPEPPTMALIGAALIGLATWGRLRVKRPHAMNLNKPPLA